VGVGHAARRHKFVVHDLIQSDKCHALICQEGMESPLVCR
jgi:hypothetical protein